ncbi:hypothetical protein [Actinomadura livida]|uniref:hypothetical protein n=1 Tax=Actinomadura livida TaxID=79909 RepID=UPI001670A9DC|nr:hypothetical protein [Actinomadura livida]GGT91496.1 hypothetical protein GCM10010208_13170 [Actinomadura livida]
MRGGWLVLILSGVVLLACPLPAVARERAEPVSRADHIAAQLRRDPVYVTDHAPRALPPDAAERIRAAVARLGVPAYVAVTPTVGLSTGRHDESLLPLLRDRLRRDGVYIVASPSSPGGEVRQYGGSRRVPLEDAWRAAENELAYDASTPERIELFVDIALSGRARERAENPPPRPKSEVRKALDADDAADRRAALIEWGVFGGGTALSGVPLLALLTFLRVRRGTRRPKGRQAAKQRQRPKKPAKGRR